MNKRADPRQLRLQVDGLLAEHGLEEFCRVVSESLSGYSDAYREAAEVYSTAGRVLSDKRAKAYGNDEEAMLGAFIRRMSHCRTKSSLASIYREGLDMAKANRWSKDSLDKLTEYEVCNLAKLRKRGAR